LISLIALLVVTWVRIDSPPYVEQSAGLWAEASWLVDHGFDYYRLRHQEKHVEDGGPRSYFSSILPTLLATIMMLTSSPAAAIVVYRLLCLASVAWILMIQFDLIRRRHGDALGIVTCLATAAMPLFAVQIEMIGLDIPMVALAMTWWWMIDQSKRKESVGWAIATFLFKPSAFVLPAAVVGYSLIAWTIYFIRGRRFSMPRYTGWAFVNGLLLLVELWILSRGGNLHGRVMPVLDVDLWVKSSPDVLVMMLLTVIGGVILFIGHVFTDGWLAGQSAARNSAIIRAQEENDLLWMITGLNVALATMLSATMTYYESRHLTVVVPFAVTVAAHSFAKISPGRNGAFAMLTVLFAFGVINRFGILYPPLLEKSRGWGIPERSLEYVHDHSSNQRAVEVTVSRRERSAILATDHFAYFLALSRLGYVSTGFASEPPVYRFTAVDADVLRILEEQPAEVIVLHAPTQLGNWPFPAYQLSEPSASDEILFHDALVPRTVIYRRHFSKDGSLSHRIRDYLDLLFSNDTVTDVSIRLAILGQMSLAYRCLAEDGTAEGSLKEDLPARMIKLLEQYREKIANETEGRAGQLRELRLQTVQDRIDEIKNHHSPRPLNWTERTSLSTWQQRIRYISPPAGPRGLAFLKSAVGTESTARSFERVFPQMSKVSRIGAHDQASSLRTGIGHDGSFSEKRHDVWMNEEERRSFDGQTVE
jgi:hypothetical protein